MSNKQYAWRGNEVLFSIVLLISLHCLGAEKELFYGESIPVLESAYNLAPRRVHFMVNSLLGTSGDALYSRNYAIFDGDPGVGKSTLALAMGYKLKWDVQKFGVNDFMQAENRNGTAVVFNQIMSRFEHCNENNLIIIDEVNQLFTNSESKHHDTDASSKSFWLFLDAIRGKKNLFVVGTTNGIGGFPPPIISRFTGAIVTITPQKNLTILKKAFFECLNNENVKIAAEAQQYIEDNIEILDGCNARDIVNLIDILKIQIVELTPKAYESNQFVVDVKHIEAALEEKASINLRFQEKPYNETDVELRERHHRENKRQFWITLGVTATLGVATILATIYFSNRAHEQAITLSEAALEAQKTLHLDIKDHQEVMQALLMKFQEGLQEKALATQAKLQEATLAAQRVMHRQSMYQQLILAAPYGWALYLLSGGLLSDALLIGGCQ